MKKLVSLAVLAAVSAGAYAQSSVTLFGVADAKVEFGRGSETNHTGLGSGGLSSSRIGFRGIEDLGGGLKAGFWLEAGYNLDTGTGTNNGSLAFQRRSTVSLLGDSWGEIRLGRDFTAPYNNVYDAFGDNGVGALLETNDLGVGYGVQTRTSNSISYFTPQTLGGFFGQAQYFRGEQVGTNAGNGYGLRLGYNNGPISAGVAYGEVDGGVAADVKNLNVGGSYDFGVAKLLLTVGQDKQGDDKTRYYVLGTTVPVGAGLIRAGWSRVSESGTDAKADKFALGYVHNLSKRTALYTTLAYVKNRGNSDISLNGSTLTNGSDNSKGLDLGIRHVF